MTFAEAIAFVEGPQIASSNYMASNATYTVVSNATLTKEGYVASTMAKIVAADKAAPVATMSGKAFLKWLQRD